MDRSALQAMQAPLKERYRDEPEAAAITLRAEGRLGDEELSCWVSREAPVGFTDIRLQFDLDTDADADADADALATLLRLTERYCVVYQTLVGGPAVTMDYAAGTVG